MSAHKKYFTVRRESGVFVIELAKCVCEIKVPDDLMHLLDAVDDGGEAAQWLVDFDRVEFCPSSVISTLIVVQRRIQQMGGRLKFSIPSAHVRLVFHRTNLDTLFEIYDRREDAIRAFHTNTVASR